MPTGPTEKIRIGFTPDEEVSVGGASILDVDGFGADCGITVDGDGVGELNFETFNGCTVKVEIEGTISILRRQRKDDSCVRSGHGAGRSASRRSASPVYRRTRGFYHLCEMKGDVGTASMEYILRDFDRAALQVRIDAVQAAARV